MDNSSRLSRQSNLELLRIVAMLLVLVVHADFLSFGSPSLSDLHARPLPIYFRFFVQSCSIVCVDLFILISGYFAIRWKARSLLSLLFQCWFYYVGCGLVLMGAGVVPFDLKALAGGVLFTRPEMWFVRDYLGLYLLAPMLNAFCENTSARLRGWLIVGFFAYQSFYGWLAGGLEFLGGYSLISFIGLYLLGRHIRLQSADAKVRSRWFGLGLYGGCVALSLLAVGVMGALFAHKPGVFDGSVMKLYAYNALWVVAAAVGLFLFFTKFDLRSAAVNRIAASAFSVYLLHANPFVLPWYTALMNGLYARISPPLAFGAAVLAACVAIFLGTVLVDQVRIWLWERLQPMAERIAERIAAFVTVRSGSLRP